MREGKGEGKGEGEGKKGGRGEKGGRGRGGGGEWGWVEGEGISQYLY